MFSFAALWLILWMLKNAAMDVSCAIKGTANPRYELKKAKARAAGQNPPAQPRYGTKDWFGDLCADGLQAQTEYRRRKAAAKRQARDQAETGRAEAEQIDGGTDQAGGRPVGEPVEKPRSARPDGEDVIHGGGPVVERHDPGLWAWSCRRGGCSGKGFDLGSEQEAIDAAAGHRCPDTNAAPGEGVDVIRLAEKTSGPDAGGAPRPEQHQQPPRPDPAPDDRPDAKVIPFARPIPPQEVPVSTDINSEVIGLDQSIAYAHSLATFAGEHGQAGNEGYIGHLTGQQVAGAALSTAHEMQEAFSNAVAAAEAHAAELEKQKAVQEAFDANPDAGDKAYQTEGR